MHPNKNKKYILFNIINQVLGYLGDQNQEIIR
jgi:hypothetical protein